MFTLPQLPYAYDALEPYIDAKTMEIHYSKHHAGYVAKLNDALAGTSYLDDSLENLLSKIPSLPETIQKAVKNNGGGHRNHTMFWDIMTPGDQSVPKDLAALIDANFGSMDQLQQQYIASAVANFGSGWTWLVLDGNTLSIVNTPNQDNPLMLGKKAILGVDVREHAYYLMYQNRRPDYLANRRKCINWTKVATYM